MLHGKHCLFVVGRGREATVDVTAGTCAAECRQPRTAMKAVEHALNVMHTMGLPLDDAILLMAIYCAYDPNRNVKGKDDTPSKEPADITSEDAQIVTRLMAKAMVRWPRLITLKPVPHSQLQSLTMQYAELRNMRACNGLSSVEITLISHQSLWPQCCCRAKAPPFLIHKHLCRQGLTFCILGHLLQSTGHRPNGQCYYHAITIAACGRELTACAWCGLPVVRNLSFLRGRSLLHL